MDNAKEPVTYVCINRGDITVHNVRVWCLFGGLQCNPFQERVVHGSGPNLSAGWRKAYVLAYRRPELIAQEREMGFTHSHNDVTSWDVFHKHGL